MKLRDFHLTLRGWFRYRRVGRRIERCMDEFSDALMQWAWRFMGLIYGEFPETAARLILSAALRKLPQLAKRLFRSVFPSRGRHARGNRRGRRVRRRRTADVLGWSERHHLGLRPVPRRQRGHESHRRNRPAHPQIAKVRNHNRHGSGGIANRASHRTTASPRPAAKLHAQPPAHRTPDRSAAAGSVGLARTAQPSLRWAEISDLVRNIFPTCRKYVVSSLL